MLYTIVPLFVGACITLGSLGFFAVWAEFKSSAAQNSYSRYTHHDTSKYKNVWPLKPYAIVPKPDKQWLIVNV